MSFVAGSEIVPLILSELPKRQLSLVMCIYKLSVLLYASVQRRLKYSLGLHTSSIRRWPHKRFSTEGVHLQVFYMLLTWREAPCRT